MRGSPGLIIILFFLLTGVSVLGVGVMSPVRLGVIQEQVIGLIHGGIVNQDLETFVDNCVIIREGEPPRAIPRTRRRVFFRDGTSLEIIFSGTPIASNAQC